MKSRCIPDLSSRPHNLTFERMMQADAASLYQAWTEKFDSWFAQPGELMMTPEIDKPFFFYNPPEWGRHAHYGRFLELEKDKVVEMAWVSGKGATFGAETVLRIELIPQGEGTMLRLTHSGFETEEHRDAHKAAWPEGIEILDKKLTKN